jgi:hypothetical protein
MASITNSLISTPNTPSHHSPSQRPLKAVLPPITQQQFDQFNNLNTEDIVKKVRVLVRNLILGMKEKETTTHGRLRRFCARASLFGLLCSFVYI